jgi:hypothetical protein
MPRPLQKELKRQRKKRTKKLRDAKMLSMNGKSSKVGMVRLDLQRAKAGPKATESRKEWRRRLNRLQRTYHEEERKDKQFLQKDSHSTNAICDDSKGYEEGAIKMTSNDRQRREFRAVASVQLQAEFTKFLERRDAGIPSDLCQYNVLLQLCSAELELTHAMITWRCMVDDNVVPDETTFAQLGYLLERLSVCRTHSQLEGLSMGVRKHMCGVLADKKTLRGIMKARTFKKQIASVQDALPEIRVFLKTHQEKWVHAKNIFKIATIVSHELQIPSRKARTALGVIEKTGELSSFRPGKVSDGKAVNSLTGDRNMLQRTVRTTRVKRKRVSKSVREAKANAMAARKEVDENGLTKKQRKRRRQKLARQARKMDAFKTQSLSEV